MPTILEFLNDPYRRQTEAVVLSHDREGVRLDRTIFYPATGISPADSGCLSLDGNRVIQVTRTVWDDHDSSVLMHLCPDAPYDLSPGEKVKATIDWSSRYLAMRIHTALHVLSVALPYPMIDGAILKGGGWATFEVDQIGVLPRELEKIVNDLVGRNMAVDATWILPPLRDRRINTRCFSWPGSKGHVRAVRIDGVDLQPCDGMHVKNTSDIGHVTVIRLDRLSATTHRCEIRLAAHGGDDGRSS
jgi:misacylated tRNA(Ala) deacylase